MDLTSEQSDGTIRLAIDGDVDLSTADRVRSAVLEALADTSCSKVVLDLSAVTFMDSTGIGVLVELQKAADGMAKRLTLHHPSERVVELLQLVALDTFFTTEPAL